MTTTTQESCFYLLMFVYAMNEFVVEDLEQTPIAPKLTVSGQLAEILLLIRLS